MSVSIVWRNFRFIAITLGTTLAQLIIFSVIAALLSAHNGDIWRIAIDPDRNEYLILAHSMLNGHGFILDEGIPDMFRTPGYPAILVPFLVIFQETYIPILIFHAFLVGLTAAILLYVGEGVGLSRKVSVIFALLYAMSVDAIYLVIGGLGSENLFIVLYFASAAIVLALTLENMRPYTSAIILGALLGFATLVRPVGIMAALPLIIGLSLAPSALVLPRFSERAKVGLLSLLVFAAILMPWMTRNYVATGEFLFSTLPTFNFVYFNIPIFLSYWDKAPETEVRTSVLAELNTVPIPELRNAQHTDELSKKMNDFLHDYALPYSLFHAVKTIPFFVGSSLHTFHHVLTTEAPSLRSPLFPTDAFNLSSAVMTGNWYDSYRILKSYWLVSAERLVWVILFAFAFIAPLLSEGLRRRYLLLFISIILWNAFLTGPVAHTRYRIAIEPFLVITAGYSFVALWQRYWREDIVHA